MPSLSKTDGGEKTPSTTDALNDADAPGRDKGGARHARAHEDESTWKAVAVLVSIGVATMIGGGVFYALGEVRPRL